MAAKKFLCKGKWSRYLVAGIVGIVAGGVIYKTTGVPLPTLILSLVGTYVYRSTQCRLPRKK
jgi:hypothetical protein